jgi:murein DD-endopeptidase MepM/ murein hydrolase activator NlpD
MPNHTPATRAHASRPFALAPCLCLLFCLCFFAVIPESLAATFAQSGFSVTVPDAVGEGQPFVADITAPASATSVSVEWLGKVLEVQLELSGGVKACRVLLGAGIGTAHGAHALRVAASGGQAGRAAVQPGASGTGAGMSGAPGEITALGSVRVTPVVFPEQRLTLPKKMVTPSKADQERIKREQELMSRALAEVTPRRLWSLPLSRPVPGEVTSAFGLKRILNGQPRNAHTGLDLDGATGEPALAAANGRVSLTGDFYYNGKSVFVDHGQGVVSMYFHLSNVDVREGQTVRAGQMVGRVGSTGRSTGPHLHFGLKVLGQSVDPTALFAAR